MNIKLLQDTPPPVPSSRLYTVMDNQKFSFPQTRSLRMDFIGKTIGQFDCLITN